MDDLISKQTALNSPVTMVSEGLVWIPAYYIKDLPPEQPDTNEWCTDCKEYDSEKHCCPRFNRVIRNALKDAQPLTDADISRGQEFTDYICNIIENVYKKK